MNINTKMSQSALIVFLSLLLCIQSASADGSRIIIMLRNGQELGGELLSAREKSLVVTKVNNVSDWGLMSHPEFIEEVFQKDIKEVTIKAKSHVLVGIGIGLLMGTVGGAINGGFRVKEKDDPISILFVVANDAAIGGLIGLLVGAASGVQGPRGDEEINVDSLQDLFCFRQYARYQKDEPVCLQTYSR